MFHKRIWGSIHEFYDIIVRDEKKIKSLLSKGVYDEYTMKRATKLHGSITNAWFAVQIYGDALRDLRRKNLRITLQELAICNGYRETAYRIFYECRELFLNAEFHVGKLSQTEREEGMEFARKQRYA